MKKNKKGISLVALSVTILVMIIFTTVIIISITNAGMFGKSNDVVLETNRQQIEDIANAAWMRAYGAGKITQLELQEAVIIALENENIDLDSYNIVVAEDGVIVTINNINEE